MRPIDPLRGCTARRYFPIRLESTSRFTDQPLPFAAVRIAFASKSLTGRPLNYRKHRMTECPMAASSRIAATITELWRGIYQTAALGNAAPQHHRCSTAAMGRIVPYHQGCRSALSERRLRRQLRCGKTGLRLANLGRALRCSREGRALLRLGQRSLMGS